LTPVALSGQNPSFTAPTSVTTLQFDLVVSDGIQNSAPDRVVIWVLEEKLNTIWVNGALGSDLNVGTRAAPMRRIQNAIDQAGARRNGADVYVAGGIYTGSLSLANGVSVYGGFNGGTWLRDVAANLTTINGGPTAVTADGASSLTIDGFTIRAQNGASSGQSSVGVALAKAVGINLTNNIIITGNGSAGRTFTDSPAGTNGANGGSGGAPRNQQVPGQPAGAPAASRGGVGGDGGNDVSNPTVDNATGHNGTDGLGTSGSGGRGGGWTFGGLLRGDPAENGRGGAPGANGTDGGSAAASFGRIDGPKYVALDGQGGTAGTSGTGGAGAEYACYISICTCRCPAAAAAAAGARGLPGAAGAPAPQSASCFRALRAFPRIHPQPATAVGQGGAGRAARQALAVHLRLPRPLTVPSPGRAATVGRGATAGQPAAVGAAQRSASPRTHRAARTWGPASGPTP
jgi:hypothetical protein